MATTPTYGLSAATLSARAFGLELSASSVPTLTDAETLFEDICGDVTALIRGLDVDPDELTDDGDQDDGYHKARRLVSNAFLAELYVLRMPDETGIKLAEMYDRRAKSDREELRKYLGALGSSRPSGDNAPGRMGSAFEARRRRSEFRQAQPGSLGRLGRMLDRGRPTRS